MTKNLKLSEVLSSHIDIIKKGLAEISSHSSKVTAALDQKSRQALAMCIYSLAKFKQTLNIQDDGNVQKILTSVNYIN